MLIGPVQILLLIVTASVAVVYAVRRYLAGSALRNIRGPPSDSWLLGHQQQLNNQVEVGDLESKWVPEYGMAYRIKGSFGEDVLALADPKGLQYVFHKSGYHFPKTAIARQITREITGPGILFAQDGDHTRIRKVMTPAFNAAQLKSFLPLFRASAQKLAGMWQELIQAGESPDSGERINVLSWLTRCTLDIIGEVGFDVQCGALDDSLNPVMHAYKNMFADAIPFPSKASLLFRSLWHLIPMPILNFVQYFPTKDHMRFRRTLKIINKYAQELIDEKTDIVMSGKAGKKDMMSVLVKANASEDPKSRISNTEMISQMSTFLLAGHETTASTTTWLLYELAKHPEYQSLIRDEIKAIRARVAERGDADFAVSDLDQMTYCLAAMKELLRLHPIVYLLARQAGRDDVIPLSTPVVNTKGEVVHEIPIRKGTEILIPIWSYNRLTQVWGPDANEFNPHRFIEHEKMGQSQTYVGVTSNLMTFSAGLQACIGWRFSIIEMQAIVVELLERFEFTIPEDKPEILRFPAGLLAPLVKSDMAAGPQMPLRVTPVQ